MLKGNKILMTGLTGSLGGTIAEMLAPHNELWGLSRYSRAGQREYWEKAGVRTIVADYSRSDLSALLPDDFDYVVNIAANNTPATLDEGMQDNAEGPALLMYHCRKVKAFLHTSTVGVYAFNPDKTHLYTETDQVGGGTMGHYTGTKLAGEGAIRAMSRALGVKTIICRMGVQYGPYSHGGLPSEYLRSQLAGRTLKLSRSWSNKHSLISNDDVARFIEPLLGAASTPARTVNWAGDEAVPAPEMITYLAELAGVEPRFEYVEEGPEKYHGEGDLLPSFPADPTLRKSITGPCQVHWRDGLKRLYDTVHERMRAEIAARR